MSSSESRPNIVVIMTDQHSPHFLGCYGNSLVKTPNLDGLAADGMRFTNTYCASPLCVPSRMSFMTTRTPSHNRVWGNHHILSSGLPTWAHALGAADYETSLIGRMHFVGSDHRHGFERRPLGEYSATHPGVDKQGGSQWTAFPGSTSGQSRPSVEIAGKGTTSYQWFDEQVTRAARDYFAEKSQDTSGRPFAAVVGYVLPHCPFVAPADLFDYYYDKVSVPEIEENQPETIRRFRDLRGILEPPLPKERVRVALAAYYALCEYSDQLIGQVLHAIEQNGFAEDTLVLYVSDHGEMAGEHGCWWKSCYYEASVGVPMIARYPGVIPEATVSDAICNLVDIGSTMIDLAEAAQLPGTDGRSLRPILTENDTHTWKNETFSELVDFRSKTDLLPSRMIRSGQWKYWAYHDAAQLPPALFDLEADPHELNDLGQDAAYESIRMELNAKLYKDWDPEQARREAEDGLACHEAIAAWGKAVQPACEDTLPAPDPPVEQDVELL